MEEKINRWQIQKIHLLNYWKFVNETFELKNGKIFITGQNASGKSNIIQLFPFMLNGDKSSKSLSATGVKQSRKMSFYYMPRDEKGNIIKGESGQFGYICLEFKKKFTEQYLTLCVGQRYVLNNQGNENLVFVAFILKDGRRIGKDFILYRKEFDKIIPYSFDELRKILNLKNEDIFRTRKEYLTAINRELFGFRSNKELEEVCDIINVLRNSDLTGNISISEVKTILLSTLPSIDEKQFEDLSTIFKNMEEAKRELVHFQEDKKMIYDVNKKFNLFNKQNIYSKYLEYMDKKDKYDSSKKEYENIGKDIENLKKSYNEEEKKIEENDLRKKDIETKIELLEEAEELKNNEKSKKELENLKKNIYDLENKIKNNSKKVEREEEKISNEEKKILNFKDSQKRNKKERENLYENLKEKNLEIKYKGHLEVPEYKDIEFPEKIRTKLADSKAGAEYYEKDILECAKLLLDFEKAEEKYNDLKDKVDDLETRKEKFEKEKESLLGEKEFEKKYYIDRYYEVSNSNTFLKISDDSLKMIDSKIKSYIDFSEKEKKEILDIKEYFYNEKQQEFNDNIVTIKTNLNDKEIKIKQVTEDLKVLKSQKEAVPTRTLSSKRCRKLLKENNIEHISLYQAIDFRDDLTEKESNLIEKQLVDSNILDSLIIPYAEIEKAKSILKENSECILTPSISKKYNFDKLKIEDTISEDLKRVVKDFLNSISTNSEDTNAMYILSSTGFFRNGVISGNSVDTKEAEYIGVLRRREKLKNDILKKEAEKAELEEIKQKFISEKKKEELNLLTLKKENNLFPTFGNIDNVIGKIKVNDIQISNLDKELKSTQKKLLIEKEKYDKSFFEKEEKCKIYSFKKSSKVYFELRDKINEYIKVLNLLEKNIFYYDEIEKNIEMARNNEKNSNQKIIEFKEMIKSDEIIKHNYLLRVKNIEEIIKDENIIQKLNEIDGLKKKILLLKKEKLDFEKTIKEIEIKKGIAENNSKDLLKKMDFCEKIFKEYISYLKEALDEDVVYYSEKMDESYAINSISDLKKYIDIWKNEKNFLKFTLEELAEELQATCHSISSKLIKLKLEFSLKPNNIVKFTNYLLNFKRRIYIQIDNEEKDFIWKKIIELDKKIQLINELLSKDMEKAVNDLISKSIGDKLLNLIQKTSKIISDSSAKMESMNTPVIVRLGWKLKKEFDNIKNILKRTSFGKEELLNAEDKRKLYNFVLDQIESKKLEKRNEDFDYQTALKDIFDYKKWFDLKIFYTKRGEKEEEAIDGTNFSGGEKSTIVMLPVLTALSFKLSKAREDAFRLMVLDEAFSVVDFENTKNIMSLIEDLDLDFIFNSPKEYCFVPNTSFNVYSLSIDNSKVLISTSSWTGSEITDMEENNE